MSIPLERVAITNTASSASHRDIAVAVIADKLGINPGDVTDDTALGDAYREIAMNIACKTGVILVSSSGMKAKTILDQLSA